MYITLYKVQLLYISHHLHTGLFTSGTVIINPKFEERRSDGFWMMLTIEQRISRTPACNTEAISSNVPKPLQIHNRTVPVAHARYTSWQDSALL